MWLWRGRAPSAGGLGHSATVWDLPSAPAGFLAGPAAFILVSKDSARHCPAQWLPWGFFSQTSKFLLGVWCVGFFPFRQDRPLPTAMTAVTGPNPCDKRTLLIITSVTSYCWFNSQTCGCSLNFNFFFLFGALSARIPGADWIFPFHVHIFYFFEQVGFFCRELGGS